MSVRRRHLLAFGALLASLPKAARAADKGWAETDAICVFDSVAQPDIVSHVEGLVFDKVRINGQAAQPPA